ncbi:oxygenase MpaB family protein [Nocardia higoensis]|uniref:oxygenase MpaB family protein n=1 Tax=Nocardia higoensis TaxID=228599 RepID=UPI00031B46F1|nr:oxygenase MpaB family protein [Nocardia higoensis]
MTAQTGQEHAVSDFVVDGPPLEGRALQRYEQFRWFCGTSLVGLFAAAYVDQGMQSDVSDATWATGRYEHKPLERNLRTMAAGQLVMWGDESVNARQLERLKKLHRDVRGKGRNGRPYSAYSPRAWNLVYLSMFFLYRNAYTPITGDTLTDEDNEIFYRLVWDKMGALSFTGKNTALPRSYAEAIAYYDELVANELRDTYMLEVGRRLFATPPAPDTLPALLRPLWPAISRVAGEVAITCGMAISRPEVREIFGFPMTRARRVEFALICRVLPILYRHLPKRLLLVPLAYNRWCYERLIHDLEETQLHSFKPDPELAPRPHTDSDHAG